MILVLKNADFSANNIGRVQVTTELSEYTKAAIAASGNASLTLEQKSAVNNFFETIGAGSSESNTIISRMRFIYLPIVAGELSKAMLNYATIDFVKDFEPNTTNWALQNNGIQGLAQGQAFTKVYDTPLMGNNISAFWLRTTKATLTGTGNTSNLENRIINIRGKQNDSLWLRFQESAVSDNEAIAMSDIDFTGMNNGIYNCANDRIECAGLTVRNDKGYNQTFHGVDYSGTLSAVTDMSAQTSQTVYVLGLGTVTISCANGIIMLGESLSESEFMAVKNAINGIRDAFNVQG